MGAFVGRDEIVDVDGGADAHGDGVSDARQRRLRLPAPVVREGHDVFHAAVVEGHDERRAPRVGREHRRAPLEAADGRERVRRPTRARADARTDVVVAADDAALEDVALGEEVDPAAAVQLGELGPELADAAAALDREGLARARERRQQDAPAEADLLGAGGPARGARVRREAEGQQRAHEGRVVEDGRVVANCEQTSVVAAAPRVDGGDERRVVRVVADIERVQPAEERAARGRDARDEDVRERGRERPRRGPERAAVAGRGEERRLVDDAEVRVQARRRRPDGRRPNRHAARGHPDAVGDVGERALVDAADEGQRRAGARGARGASERASHHRLMRSMRRRRVRGVDSWAHPPAAPSLSMFNATAP